MNRKTDHLAVLSSVRTERKSALLDHPYHEMILALQTTLNIEHLLDLFSVHLQPFVPHGGSSFHNDPLTLELRTGKKGRHSCSYQLVLENENLGEWRLTRDKRFSEQEFATIEAFLCRLLYPLRNALQYQQALQSASVDPLTKTLNRGVLQGAFQREWELSRRHGAPLSVILLDIDHFKKINDAYGHDKGDAVLRSVATCLQHSVRSSDMVFRYGGEEFVVLLSNTSAGGAFHLAERIRQALEKLSCNADEGFSLRVTASLGVATLAPNESKETLLKRADQAMYRAKQLGRNQVVLAGAEA
jgi:diguanylate cyclase (GGDEF)-like protein